jgi:hypothetical protein
VFIAGNMPVNKGILALTAPNMDIDQLRNTLEDAEIDSSSIDEILGQIKKADPGEAPSFTNNRIEALKLARDFSKDWRTRAMLSSRIISLTLED